MRLFWAPNHTPYLHYPFDFSEATWLAYSPGWSEAQGSLTPIGPSAGRFDAGALTLPGVAPGTTVEAIVLGWTSSYQSYGDAYLYDRDTAHGGPTGLFTFVVGSPEAPGTILGPGGFSGLSEPPLAIIPEPSALALAAMGAVWLLLLGRRDLPNSGT